MSDKDNKKSKWFRVVVAGATTDGRVIDPSWIQQMAANYDTNTYTAVVNVEHFKSIMPNSVFGSYGTVTALKVEDVNINGETKSALYAQINPNDNLIALTKSKQKLFTSVEISPKFADTDQAYLIGLAVTDNPASLGTEMLEFAANAKVNPLAHQKQDPNNLFTVATETAIEFEEEKTSVLDKVKQMFTKQDKKQNHNFAQHEQAVIEVATQASNTAKSLEQLQTDFNNLQTDYNDLKTKLGEEPKEAPRPKNNNFNQANGLGVDC